ncbi:MAG TPA: GNAT family N-acetyltransferase [Rudaea sp.]|nr:GNAT family N-acetyltransferase [Rudaea sp.]
MPASLTARAHQRLNEIDAAAWNALLPNDNPFVGHAFLSGLEEHGCLHPRRGWNPHHVALYRGDELVAAAPCYLKGNSHGEYVFDWSWAGAYERNGLDYYPKLLSAVPYSPVTGPRLLVGQSDDAPLLRQLLLECLRTQTDSNGLSSVHLNFADDTDAAAFGDANDWLPRFDWQFHWRNAGWGDFSEFLGAMSSKKRKNIRQEREHVARAGVTCEILHGDEMSAADWRTVHAFYESTFDEKGNYPALTLKFFEHLGRAMPRRVLAVIARRAGEPIAAALLLRSSDTLYGRYWGSSENIPGLHFEVCYYQGIEYCLKHRLTRFEPGAQGEHKLARGFLPTITRSFHYLADARFRTAIRDSLRREAISLENYRDELMSHSPFLRA